MIDFTACGRPWLLDASSSAAPQQQQHAALWEALWPELVEVQRTLAGLTAPDTALTAANAANGTNIAAPATPATPATTATVARVALVGRGSLSGNPKPAPAQPSADTLLPVLYEHLQRLLPALAQSPRLHVVVPQGLSLLAEARASVAAPETHAAASAAAVSRFDSISSFARGAVRHAVDSAEQGEAVTQGEAAQQPSDAAAATPESPSRSRVRWASSAGSAVSTDAAGAPVPVLPAGAPLMARHDSDPQESTARRGGSRAVRRPNSRRHSFGEVTALAASHRGGSEDAVAAASPAHDAESAVLTAARLRTASAATADATAGAAALAPVTPAVAAARARTNSLSSSAVLSSPRLPARTARAAAADDTALLPLGQPSQVAPQRREQAQTQRGTSLLLCPCPSLWSLLVSEVLPLPPRASPRHASAEASWLRFTSLGGLSLNVAEIAAGTTPGRIRSWVPAAPDDSTPAAAAPLAAAGPGTGSITSRWRRSDFGSTQAAARSAETVRSTSDTGATEAAPLQQLRGRSAGSLSSVHSAAGISDAGDGSADGGTDGSADGSAAAAARRVRERRRNAGVLAAGDGASPQFTLNPLLPDGARPLAASYVSRPPTDAPPSAAATPASAAPPPLLPGERLRQRREPALWRIPRSEGGDCVLQGVLFVTNHRLWFSVYQMAASGAACRHGRATSVRADRVALACSCAPALPQSQHSLPVRGAAGGGWAGGGVHSHQGPAPCAPVLPVAAAAGGAGGQGSRRRAPGCSVRARPRLALCCRSRWRPAACESACSGRSTSCRPWSSLPSRPTWLPPLPLRTATPWMRPPPRLCRRR